MTHATLEACWLSLLPSRRRSVNLSGVCLSGVCLSGVRLSGVSKLCVYVCVCMRVRVCV